MPKSYQHEISLNKAKTKFIEDMMYPEGKRVAKILMDKHMNYFYRHCEVSASNDIYKDIKTSLSERSKDCINRQVVGMFKSKLTNFKQRFVKIVMKNDSLSDELKKDLCIINKYGTYFKNEDNKGKKYKVPFESIKLARGIFKHKFGKLPCCKNINMTLQDKIAIIEKPKQLKHRDFKYVIKLSAGMNGERGKFMYIPVRENTYAVMKPGILSSSCTLIFKEGKLKCVQFTKTDDEAILPQLNDLTISMDIGVNVLFALTDGSCYGEYYLRKLKVYFKKYDALIKSLKEKHGKRVNLKNFKEFNDLVQRIKDFSKNEINRIFNKIYKRYKPNKFILEDLDFQGSKLRKKTNALLAKFGLGYITKKLEQMKMDYGVQVSYTDAPYTSQTCSVCGYTDKKNRKTQKEFKCKCCLYKCNADVNASRTIKLFNERFGETAFHGKTGRNKKRTLLIQSYMDSKVWMDNGRIIQVLLENFYFKDFHDVLRERLGCLS